MQDELLEFIEASRKAQIQKAENAATLLQDPNPDQHQEDKKSQLRDNEAGLSSNQHSTDGDNAGDSCEVDAEFSSLNLSESHIESLRDAYEVFDCDGNGGISKEELGSVMRAMGMIMTRKELDVAFENADSDKSGTIEFNEFVHIMSSSFSQTTAMMKSDVVEKTDETDWIVAFDLFDSDHDGFIEPHDIGRVLRNMGVDVSDYELEDMLSAADTSATGKLCFKDFEQVMRHGVTFQS